MLAEWDVPFHLVTEQGTLLINQSLTPGSQRRLQLNASKCSAILPVRSTPDDIPQGDGQISHRRWRSGFQVHLSIEPVIWKTVDDVPHACDADLREMLDLLGLHLNEMIRTGQVAGPGARLYFSPTGAPDRMFDRLQLLGAPTPAWTGGDLGGVSVEVDLDSAFPYYIEAAETDTHISDGATVTINNAGNTDYFPVFEIYGPFDGFTLVNHSVQDLDGNDIKLVYDHTLPGAVSVTGGDWLEVEFFRETCYRNGHLNNRKAGIDFRVSDFFPLAPGNNDIQINFVSPGSGAYTICKSNGAWA